MFLEKTRSKIFEILLNFRKKQSSHSGTPVNYSNSKTIGIIYHVQNNYEDRIINEIVNQIEKDGKKVSSLEYLTDNSPQDFRLKEMNHFFLREKELNFFKIPKETVISKFSSKNYDILLNLAVDCPKQLHYVSAVTSASFKASFYTEKYGQLYDVMYDPNGSTDFHKVINSLMALSKRVSKN